MIKTKNDYEKIVSSLKKRKKAAAIADICASTALPLEKVRELLPKAADEYSGHLQVTEQGEILYSFPDGFSSRYRGFYPALKKVFRACSLGLKKTLVFLFKTWIVFTLIGYFIFFIVLALASVFLSIASKSSDNRRSGSVYFGPNLFGIIWRIWFFSEITKPHYAQTKPVVRKEEKRPMHKAVFSFVFGDDDPNKDFTDDEDKAVIAYIQSNNGVINLTEFMAFKGINSLAAEREIISFCVRFGGSPEVTDEGAIVYRFDWLLMRADTRKFTELSPIIKRLKSFSINPKKSNISFACINAVNLVFGSYFLYHSLNTGLLITELQTQNASYLYAFTHFLLQIFSDNPVSIIMVVLGLVPVIFSIFFWLIPAVRGILLSRENESIKLQNFKRLGYNKIWSSPQKVIIKDFNAPANECKPKSVEQAAEQCIKDIGAYSSPEVTAGEDGQICYSFNELESEKISLNKYRVNLDQNRGLLGKKIYDTSLAN
ncbi:MAG: hypothetical protein LBB81_01260 [Treponema sp.]|nr:hypothetical protein [Treponema sp.]